MSHIPSYKDVARKAGRVFRKLRGSAFPPLPPEELFPSEVIVHFSHHRCMTVYYGAIMRRLGEEFNFYTEHFRADDKAFERAVMSRRGKRVLRLNNVSGIHFEKFPPYKGSHFIRDPRDLIVSGYHYHLWTKEAWCIAPEFDWNEITAHPCFMQHIESKSDRFPRNISYQEYLKSLDTERGMILELIWRQFGFSEMEKWKSNVNIVEFKYEDVVGNEVESFRKIFTHYGFHPKLIERGLKIVNELSLKNKSKGEKSHVRKGTAAQWKSEFTPLVKEAFKNLNGGLLITLGYEKDNEW